MVSKVGGAHDGYDLRAAQNIGTPVYASYAGYVVRTEDQSEGTNCLTSTGYGKVVYIAHGNGYETRYAHLDSYVVHGQNLDGIGEYVATGQLIGYMGITGHTTCTPHVHFELINNNLNPKYMNVNAEMTGIPIATVPNPPSGYFTAQSPIGFNGLWFARDNYPGGTTKLFAYGQAGDIPVMGDWNGDGKDTPGVVRYNRATANLEWLLSNTKLTTAPNWSTLTLSQTVIWGAAGDTPIPGNWDGVNGDNVGIVRRVGIQLQWHLQTVNPFLSGQASDQPVAGNWDCSGGDTPGLLRGSNTGVAPPGDGQLWWFLTNGFGTWPSYTPFVWGYTYPNAQERGTSSPWNSGTWNASNCSRAVVARDGAVQWWMTNALSTAGVMHQMAATSNDFAIPADWDTDAYDDYIWVA